MLQGMESVSHFHLCYTHEVVAHLLHAYERCCFNMCSPPWTASLREICPLTAPALSMPCRYRVIYARTTKTGGTTLSKSLGLIPVGSNPTWCR